MTEKLRVAIVDDTPDMRLLVRLSLELDPHIDVVAEAADGLGAVEVARHHQPDVMLLDLAMPVMDGMQALPQVVEASPDTAVLVLSGFAAKAMADEVVAAGARGYLQKGLGAEQLCERVWEASGRPRPMLPLEQVFALPREPGPPLESSTEDRDLAARAAEAAPSGLVVLGAPPGEPATRWSVRYLNPEARRLLGISDGGVGAPVGDLAPDLADALAGLGAQPTSEPQSLPDAAGAAVSARRVDDEVVVALTRAQTGRPDSV